MTARPAPPSPTLPRLLTDTEVAHMLALPSVQALRDMRSRGDGPPVVRLGTRIRYYPKDVAEWIAAHREEPRRTRKERAEQ